MPLHHTPADPVTPGSNSAWGCQAPADQQADAGQAGQQQGQLGGLGYGGHGEVQDLRQLAVGCAYLEVVA